MSNLPTLVASYQQSSGAQREKLRQQVAAELWQQLNASGVALCVPDSLLPDLVQSTVVLAFERLESPPAGANPVIPQQFLAYLKVCLRHAYLDQCRARKRRPHSDLDDLSEQIAGSEPDTSEQLIHLEQRRIQETLLQEVLAEAPENYASVLRWYYLDGLTVDEIGQRLKKKPDHIYKLLQLARDWSRERMVKRLAFRRLS